MWCVAPTKRFELKNLKLEKPKLNINIINALSYTYNIMPSIF